MSSMLLFPSNTKCSTNVGLMLGHHRKCLVYTGQDLTKRGGENDEVPSGQVAKFCQKKKR